MDDGSHKPLNEEALVMSRLLHCVIYCNGYGHLVCLNGIEGGSKFLIGREIMDLWDRICTNLFWPVCDFVTFRFIPVHLQVCTCP
jgi:hypothetical protein